MPRARMLDTTRDQTYGELRGPLSRDGVQLYGGDVVELDDGTFNRFKAMNLVEETDESPHRQVAADPRFASPERGGPVYDAMVTRPVPVPPANATVGDFIGGTPPGVSHPTNVAPEVALRLHQLEVENAQLRAQVAGEPGPEPNAEPNAVDDLTDRQKQMLIDAGYDDPAKVAAASDEDLANAGLSKAAIAKLRGAG